jgi:hypothetical protein
MDPSNTSTVDMDDLRFERLDEENADDWEQFNNSSDEGSFFHSLRWKEIAEKSSGIRDQYSLLYRNEDVIGIFPFVGDNFYRFGGLAPARDPQRLHAILRDSSDPFVMQHVIGELRRLRRNLRISFLHFSTLHTETLDTISDIPSFALPDRGDMILDLSRYSPEMIWGTFSAKKGQRKFIRRFEEKGFSITEAMSVDDLKLFYEHYYNNIKFIGEVPQPFARFTDLCDGMPDDVRITLLSKGSLVAGGMLMVTDKPRSKIHTLYLSLNRDLPNTYHPPYYLWWEAINWAWENHYEKVGFGVQAFDEDSPRYRIKYDLGARIEAMMYSRVIPLTNLFAMGLRWGQWPPIAKRLLRYSTR